MEKVIVRSDEVEIVIAQLSETKGFEGMDVAILKKGAYVILGPGSIPILPREEFELVLILADQKEALSCRVLGILAGSSELSFLESEKEVNMDGRVCTKLAYDSRLDVLNPEIFNVESESTFSAQVKMLVKAGVRDETAEQFLVDLQRKRPFYDFKNYVAGMEFTSGGPFGLENLRMGWEEDDTGTIPTGFRALGSETNIIPGSARMEHAEQLIRAIVIKELIEELKTQDDIGPYLAAELKKVERELRKAIREAAPDVSEEQYKKLVEGTW